MRNEKRKRKRCFFLFFAFYLLPLALVFAQEKPDSLAVSEVERLKYENLVTKLQLVRLQKDALAEQYRKLLEEEGRLQQEIPALLREILKAHGQPDGSIDWEKRRVVPKPPGGGAGIPAGEAGQARMPAPPSEQKKPKEKK